MGGKKSNFLAVLTGIAAVATIVGVIYTLAQKHQPTQNASSTGNNSPAINAQNSTVTYNSSPAISVQNQTTTGNNSPVINAPNSTFNYNDTNAIARAVAEGMKHFNDTQEPELLKEFPGGYVLFAVTGRQQIVPLNSTWDKRFKIDWSTGYSVTVTNGVIDFILPDIEVDRSVGRPLSFGRNENFLQKQEGARLALITGNHYSLIIKVAEIHDDNITMVLGMTDKPVTDIPTVLKESFEK